MIHWITFLRLHAYPENTCSRRKRLFHVLLSDCPPAYNLSPRLTDFQPYIHIQFTQNVKAGNTKYHEEPNQDLTYFKSLQHSAERIIVSSSVVCQTPAEKSRRCGKSPHKNHTAHEKNGAETEYSKTWSVTLKK